MSSIVTMLFLGSSAYFVNTEWKRKADLEIAYNNGYSDAEYKI